MSSATRTRMDDAVDSLQRRLGALRTGRASVDMVAHLQVAAWGSRVPLAQVAQIGTQPPRGILVTAHDPSLVPAIERTLVDAELGASPRVDGPRLRIELAPPSAEGRERLRTTAKDEAEQARVAVRLARRDAINELRRRRAAAELSEARLNGRSKDIQTWTDERITRIDALLAAALADIDN